MAGRRELAFFALASLSLSACSTAPAAGDSPAHPAESPERLYRAKCAACHRLRDPSSQTRNGWAAAMAHYGPKAHLSSVEHQEILRWLQDHASDTPVRDHQDPR